MFAVVELEGLEPSSKQAAKMLSTCLAFHLGFGKALAKGAPGTCLSPWGFRPDIGAVTGLACVFLMFPGGRPQAGLPGKQMALNSFC